MPWACSSAMPDSPPVRERVTTSTDGGILEDNSIQVAVFC